MKDVDRHFLFQANQIEHKSMRSNSLLDYLSFGIVKDHVSLTSKRKRGRAKVCNSFLLGLVAARW